MSITTISKKLRQKNNLSSDEMESVFSEIFSTKCSENDVRDFLVLLFQKGETFEEILGAARFLLKNGRSLTCQSRDIIDCCGTGGDQKNTFNFSTAVAFVLAGAGCVVAKHGNRAVSSKSGSADILKELGVNVEASDEVVKKCIDEVGIGFLYAPNFYPLLKQVAAVRKSISHRTIFNLLGPLLNPARAKKQLVGVYDKKYVPILAEVLKELGSESAIVVSSEDGMDEFSLTSHNNVSRLQNGKIQNLNFDPRESGYAFCTEKDLRGGTEQENAIRLKTCLKGHSQPLDHVVHINAAWGLMAAGRAQSFMDGLLLAQQAISSGRAFRKLEDLIEASHTC